MLFNSYEFVFAFLPVVFFGFFFISRRGTGYAVWWLILASVFFYAFWNAQAVLLLLGSICANYCFGRRLLRSGSAAPEGGGRKFLLFVSVAFNLTLLGIFKYANFFLTTVNEISLRFSPAGWSGIDIALPLGISFYTFTQIAFLVDTYRGEVESVHFPRYLLFVTYFPHLIAGPIIHHRQVMPQFEKASTYRLNYDNLAAGLVFLAIGLFKKVGIADEWAIYANGVFDAAGHGGKPMMFEAWAGAVSYAFQIYFDFSAYSDIALGVSRLFNITLPINFNSPYKAPSIIEFWRRWHISLSTFLRDYLYIPLGGSRSSRFARYRNLMITMLLGGLWHGASWTFVLWGGLHGLYLIVNHVWRSATGGGLGQFLGRPLAAVFGVTLTFVSVVFAWVPFRADNFSATRGIWNGMLGFNGGGVNLINFTHGGLFRMTELSGATFAKLLLPCMIIVWALPNAYELKSIATLSKYRALAASALVITLFFTSFNRFGTYSPYLYFQF